jgi:hypothetical protein
MILPAGLVANALAEVTVYVGTVAAPVVVPTKPLVDVTGPEKVVLAMIFPSCE